MFGASRALIICAISSCSAVFVFERFPRQSGFSIKKAFWRGRVYSNQDRSPYRRPVKKGCKISALQASVFLFRNIPDEQTYQTAMNIFYGDAISINLKTLSDTYRQCFIFLAFVVNKHP